MVEGTQETEVKQTKDKMFRITEAENQKLQLLIELAYTLDEISNATLQEFMLYSIDCARERLKLVYAQKRR
jgi:hypothetical protein